MKRKLRNTTRDKGPALIALGGLLALWIAASALEWVPGYLLPAPWDVAAAFATEAPLLLEHSLITLQEAFYGLVLGVGLGFLFAAAMDAWDLLYRALYPILVLTQTIPTVAIAPLLVLWFGYEMAPKIILIVIVTFFPVTVGLLDGFRAADRDAVALLRSIPRTSSNRLSLTPRTFRAMIASP